MYIYQQIYKYNIFVYVSTRRLTLFDHICTHSVSAGRCVTNVVAAECCCDRCRWGSRLPYMGASMPAFMYVYVHRVRYIRDSDAVLLMCL